MLYVFYVLFIIYFNITKSSQKTLEKGPGISKWYLGTRVTPEHAMMFAIFALLDIKIPKTHSCYNQTMLWKTHAYNVLEMHVIDAGLLDVY